MEKMGEAFSLRLTAAEMAAVEKLAKDQQRPRSWTMRQLMAYALQHMPEGWKP